MVLRHDDVLLNIFKQYYDYVVQEIEGLHMEVSTTKFSIDVNCQYSNTLHRHLTFVWHLFMHRNLTRKNFKKILKQGPIMDLIISGMPIT